MGKLVMGLLIVVLCFGSAFAAETGSSAAATAPVSGSAPAAREYNFGDMTSQTLATNA